MISPDQTLLHLTSRGSRVRKLKTGAVGQWINESAQPMSNINKFGLLHYSVPKTLDMVDNTNRQFGIRFHFIDGDTAEVTVTLPRLDYYNVTVDTPNGEDNVYMDQACLTEILQTSINWAIQKKPYVLLVNDGPYRTNRLGCIVKVVDGRFKFYFGYRGNVHTVTAVENAAFVPPAVANSPYFNMGAGTDVVKPNTGCPWPDSDLELPNAEHGWLRVMAQTSGADPAEVGNRYNWVDTAGVGRSSHFNEGPDDAEEFYPNFALKSVEFHNLSPRMQFMLGSDLDAVGGSQIAQDSAVNDVTAVFDLANTRTLRRGRICLVDYKYAELVAPTPNGTHIIELAMPGKSNIYPPSFMFMNLTTQGTKTKVLGHDAQRGGWSIPCAANEFRSKFNNYPWSNPIGIMNQHATAEYSIEQARNMPMLMNIGDATKAKAAAKDGPAAIYYQGNGAPALCLFDPVPRNAEEIALNFGAPALTALCEDNYSLVVSTGAGVPDGTGGPFSWLVQHRFGSRMIHFGDTTSMTAQGTNPPRKNFGVGAFGTAGPTFTVSMITPMWIYTDVPNSTVQTLDVQLMWGDTAKNVDDATAEPCQLSLIASQ